MPWTANIKTNFMKQLITHVEDALAELATLQTKLTSEAEHSLSVVQAAIEHHEQLQILSD